MCYSARCAVGFGFTNNDRLFFIQLYRWFPSVLKAIKIIPPETLVRGIVPDFAATGVGNLGTWEADRKSVGICGA